MKNDHVALTASQYTPQQLAEMRSKGMRRIRLAFLERLLSINTEIITLSIYWENGPEFVNDPELQDVNRKLVHASTPRVSGLFKDAWLLHYPYDADIRAKVNAELDRMVEQVRHRGVEAAA